MKILVVIPARGGSKRIPNKNIKQLGGKPLICWTLDLIKSTSYDVDIIVSTDDIEIAKIAQENNIFVPWLRPEDLSTDTSSTVDVVLHSLNWYQLNKGSVDGILVLQPTSPFRSIIDIEKGLELFKINNFKTVIGVSKSVTHPAWCFSLANNGELEPVIDSIGLSLRSQDLKPVYEVNGSFYLISPKELISQKSFFSNSLIPLLIDDAHRAIDIDTELDWLLAETILNFYKL